MTLAVAVVVIVVASTGAFVLANANDGAPDPETAVRTFVEAAAAGDGRALLAASMPSEREPIAEYVPGILDELERLGLVGPLDLNRAGLVDVAAVDLRTEAEPVDVDTSRVVVDGGHLRGRWAVDGGPLNERLRRVLVDDLGLDPPQPGETFDLDLAAHPIVVMSVRELGGWHVSLYETLAEAWRQAADAPRPSWGRGPTATGSDTPEDAVRDLLGAAAALDATRAVALTYPPETRALYDYSTLFLPGSRRLARQAVEDEGFALTVGDISLRSEGSGPERHVTVEELTATWGAGSDWTRLRIEGGCGTWEYAPAPAAEPTRVERRCDGDVSAPSAETAAGPYRQVSAFSELGRVMPTFVVLERSGRWFVSPTRTVLRTLDEILVGLQPAQADDFAARLGDVWEVYRPEPYRDRPTTPLAALGVGA